MPLRLSSPFILLLLLFIISACATKQPSLDSEHVSTAKRFLHNINAGEMGLAGLQKGINKNAAEQPGMAELAQRATANITVEDFEELAAKVYSQNLSHEHLSELANFSEMPSISKFFRLIFADIKSDTVPDQQAIMRQFNADELTDIFKFTQSDGYKTLNQSLPKINRELAEAGKKMGEVAMREYLEQQ